LNTKLLGDLSNGRRSVTHYDVLALRLALRDAGFIISPCWPGYPPTGAPRHRSLTDSEIRSLFVSHPEEFATAIWREDIHSWEIVSKVPLTPEEIEAQRLAEEAETEAKRVAEQVSLELERLAAIAKPEQRVLAAGREAERAASEARRRAKGIPSRQEYLAAVRSKKPWVEAGVSRATWYRRHQ
jgi:hypothetical protein